MKGKKTGATQSGWFAGGISPAIDGQCLAARKTAPGRNPAVNALLCSPVQAMKTGVWQRGGPRG